MGFEVAIVVAIFLLSGLVLGSSYYGAYSTSNELVEDARQDSFEIQQMKMQASLTINSITMMGDETSHSLVINVTNQGSVSTSGEDMEILIDGDLVSATLLSQYEIVMPQETVRFLVNDLSGSSHKIKVISESGISAYGNYN